MGMDVFGKNPTHEGGEYFRANVWWWRPIAELTELACSEADILETFNKCEHWGSNDGDGLNAEDAILVADAIKKMIDDGSMKAIIEARQAQIDAIPDDVCKYCDGTGIRTDVIGQTHKMPEKIVTTETDPRDRKNERPHPRKGETGWCNGCDGVGKHRPFSANYPASVETMNDWQNFMRRSGGFEIC